MRLVCPKCAAQYEVGEDAIPEAGRDVQCSDCGQGWFQRRPPVAPAQARVAAEVPQPFAPPPPFLRSGQGEPPEAVPATAMPVAVPRRPLDEQVMAILRDEALREAAARRADAARAEENSAVPDPMPPPVPPVGPVLQPARLPPEPLRPDQQAPDLPVLPRPVARRAILPDIEEINSTLTAGSHRNSPVLPVAKEDARPGFRAGFGLMMAVVILAAAAYGGAPRITALLPQSAGMVAAYVNSVDQLRRQLDATVTAAQRRIESFLQSGG